MLVLLLAVAFAAATAKPVDWKAMIPAVRLALETQFPDERVEEHYPVAIARAADIADITGDGVSEALVYLGTGGASTDQMALMRIENNKPVVARFRGRDGKVSSTVFLRGASVRHGDGIDMLPNEHAVYSSHYATDDDGKLDKCSGEAYQWNRHTKTFDYSPRLSKKLAQSSCSETGKMLLRP
jgi:hypothetical protein